MTPNDRTSKTPRPMRPATQKPVKKSRPGDYLRAGRSLLSKGALKWKVALEELSESSMAQKLPAIAGLLIEASIPTTIIAAMGYQWTVTMTPVPMHSGYLAFAVMYLISALVSRSRIRFCVTSASDPTRRRTFSKRRWRSLFLGSAVGLVSTSALMFFGLGLLGTHLTLILTTPAVVMAMVAALLMLCPPPSSIFQSIEISTNEAATPAARIAGDALDRLGRKVS